MEEREREMACVGAISAPCVRRQARPKALMELQSAALLKSRYVLLLEFDGREPRVELADAAKPCAQLLLRLVRERLPRKSQDELEALLRMVHPNEPFEFDDGVRVTLRMGWTLAEGEGTVWSVARNGRESYHWTSEELTVTQFLASVLKGDGPIRYELELHTARVAAGSACRGGDRIRFTKLLKLLL